MELKLSNFRDNQTLLQNTIKLNGIKTKKTVSNTTIYTTKETINETTTLYTVLNINIWGGVGNAADRSRVSDRLSTSRLIELVRLIKIDVSFRVCPNRIMDNNHSCHVFPFMATHIEMFPVGLHDFFGLYSLLWSRGCWFFCGGHLFPLYCLEQTLHCN